MPISSQDNALLEKCGEFSVIEKQKLVLLLSMYTANMQAGKSGVIFYMGIRRKG